MADRRLAAIPVALALTLLSAAGKDSDQEIAAVMARRNWWAFKPVVRPPVPSLDSSQVANPIDAFLAAAMQTKKVTPSPPLDRAHLLRRVTFDLTGLPPTPEETSRFLADRSP